MRGRFVLPTAFLLCVAALPAEQPLPIATPESVGMSSDRLARIGAWLDGIVERKEAAGFVTLIARRAKVVHYEARGTRGLTVRDPMPKDAIFDLASMTKAITVTAALALLEEGRFTLDEPVSKYLPELAEPRVESSAGATVAAEHPIAIRQLFTHSSGAVGVSSRAEMYSFPTLESYVRSVADTPLRYQPGSSWLYGASHDILALLVQRVSGKPLDAFVQERILSPIGMADTHYWPPASKNGRRAILVVQGQDDLDSTSRRPLEAEKRATYIGGGSGLYSTAADYWRFCQMLLNGGAFAGQRVLAPRTVSWIAQDHLGEVDRYERPGTVFGLGFAVVDDPARLGWYYSKGSYYWGGSQGTVFWIDPAEELIGILMVQVTPRPGMMLREKLAALTYGAIVD